MPMFGVPQGASMFGAPGSAASPQMNPLIMAILANGLGGLSGGQGGSPGGPQIPNAAGGGGAMPGGQQMPPRPPMAGMGAGGGMAPIPQAPMQMSQAGGGMAGVMGATQGGINQMAGLANAVQGIGQRMDMNSNNSSIQQGTQDALSHMQPIQAMPGSMAPNIPSAFSGGVGSPAPSPQMSGGVPQQSPMQQSMAGSQLPPWLMAMMQGGGGMGGAMDGMG